MSGIILSAIHQVTLGELNIYHRKNYQLNTVSFCYMSLMVYGLLLTQSLVKAGDQNCLRVIVDSPVLTLNPSLATDATSQRIQNLVFSSLVGRGRDLKPRPQLAKSWSNEGAIKWSFVLRKGIRFSNGIPLTAQHIKDSLDHYANIKPLPGMENRHERVFSQIKDVSVFSPHSSKDAETKIVVTLRDANPYFINDLYLAKVFLVEGSNQIGSGGFFVKKSLHNGVLLENTLENTKMQMPRCIRFSYIKDDTTRYQKLIKNETDLIASSLSVSKTDYAIRKGIPYTMNEGISQQYLNFRGKNALLFRREVRKYIALHLDLEEYRRMKLAMLTSELTGFLPEKVEGAVMFSLRNISLSKKEEDIAKAAILDFKNKNQSIDFAFTSSKENRELALYIASKLQKIGIGVRLVPRELASFLAELRQGKHDLYVTRWVGIVDPTILPRIFKCDQIKELNRSQYCNPKLDFLMSRALLESDSEKRKQQWKEVQKILWEDLPVLPMWYWNHLYLYSNGYVVENKGKGCYEAYPSSDFVVFNDFPENTTQCKTINGEGIK